MKGKNTLFIIISIIILIVLSVILSYSYFLINDTSKNNTISVGDLKVNFCEDVTCKKTYPNYGKVIGTKIIDGKSTLENIYPYKTDEEALSKEPYVFNIKNTGALTIGIIVKLNEDKDYVPKEDKDKYESLTKLYKDNLKIGINNCNEGINKTNVKISTFGSLNNNIIIHNDKLEAGKGNIYCLWTWLDNKTPEDVQSSYFVANLGFKAEYIQENTNENSQNNLNNNVVNSTNN